MAATATTTLSLAICEISPRSHSQPFEIRLTLDVLQTVEYFIHALPWTVACQQRKLLVNVVTISWRLRRAFEVNDALLQYPSILEPQRDACAGRHMPCPLLAIQSD